MRARTASLTCLLFRRETLLRGGGFPGRGDADFIAQLDDDALGRFLAHAFDLAKRGDIARHYQAAKADRGDSVQHCEGEFRADATDVVDEKEEEIAFFRRGEAVENVGIFADLEMGQDLGFAARRGKHCRKWREECGHHSRRRLPR